MSTTDGLYLLVEGELVKVTEAVLAAWLAEDPTNPTVGAKHEARVILGVMNQGVERIRARQNRRRVA